MRPLAYLACVLSLSLPTVNASAVEASVAHGEVVYVLADRAYVSLGGEDGIVLDTELEVLAGGRVIANLQVVEVAPRSSAARFVNRRRAPRPGDRVRAVVAAPHPAKAEAKELAAPGYVDSGAWAAATEAGLAKVHFAGDAKPLAALRPMRSSAHLKGVGWVYLDATGGGTVQREQLDLVISGPIDAAGRFVVDADMTATAQVVGTDNGRYREGRAYWLDVYRAALWFRGVEGLGLGVGRLPVHGLRYGLVDGAFADHRFGEGPTLKFAAGLRPDTSSMGLAADRPTASLALEGDSFLSWGLATYGVAVSWLGRDHTKTEGTEANLDLGFDVTRLLWVGVDAGGAMVVPDTGGSTRFVLDRAGLATTLRIGGETTVHLAGRRLEEAGLGSDLLLLPAGYLPGVVTYDAFGGIDSNLGKLGPVVLDLSVAGGGVVEPGGDHNMSWASPGLVVRLPTVKQVHGRLAYRFEYGWVTGHLGELGLGLRPTEALTVDLMHQGGVLLTNSRHQMLVVQTTWVSLGYRLLERFEVALRGRGIYGEAGQGVEAMLLFGGRDLI
jgi:hypothetical protein